MSESVTFNQIEQLINLLSERFQGSAPSATAVVDAISRESRVSWSNFPKLDLSEADKLESWFLSFEARMQAARAPEENWMARFLECPEIDESVKARVRSFEVTTYQELRLTLLKEHGPIDPINYYRRAMYRVKGVSREEIREQLIDLFIKHNRACFDEGREALRLKDLCYPFINAFSATIRHDLEQKLALVFAQVEPFEHLFRMAPSKQDVTEINFMQSNVGPVATSSQRQSNRVVSFKRFRQNGNNLSNKQRSCLGCGGLCKDRNNCPAQALKCFNCNRMGHIKKVCSSPSRSNPFRNPATSN